MRVGQRLCFSYFKKVIFSIKQKVKDFDFFYLIEKLVISKNNKLKINHLKSKNKLHSTLNGKKPNS